MTAAETIIAATHQMASTQSAEGSYAWISIVEAKFQTEIKRLCREIDRLERLHAEKIDVIIERLPETIKRGIG